MTTPIAYQAATMAVELYTPAQLVAHYNWTHDRHGNVNPVLHARFTAADGEFDGYAKPFDWNDLAQATTILNEVTGWLLARASGLPCAARAFFIQLAAADLPRYTGAHPLPAPDAQGFVICFATQAVNNTAIKGLYLTDLLAKEQSEWGHCDQTSPFDEALANTDRHVFNLLRRGSGDFVLIDHGNLLRDMRLPYPLHWQADAIEAMTDKPFANVLHTNTYPLFGRTAPGVCAAGCSQGLTFSAKIHQSVQRTLFEVSFWCSRLLPGTSERWLRFLHQRTHKEPMSELLHKRFGLIPIHVP